MGVFIVLLCLIGLGAWWAWWVADWKKERAVGRFRRVLFSRAPRALRAAVLPSGSEMGSGRPRFDLGSLAAEGCAVASAAMTLASYGVDVDPGRLNKFLTTLPGGYTSQGWIYWEKAAEFDSGIQVASSAALRELALLFPDRSEPVRQESRNRAAAISKWNNAFRGDLREGRV